MITASSLARRLACPASHVLAKADTTSPAAIAGREQHEDLAELAELPEVLKREVPISARSEVKLAYDVSARRGRIVGEGADRTYGTAQPFEVYGSADVVGLDRDANGNALAAVVIDWKTGNDVEPAITNPQTLFYALAASSALGFDSAIVKIIYTRTGRVDRAVFDALDLVTFANRLEDMFTGAAALQLRKAAGETLDTSEGSWCTWCPSKHVCPAKNALLAQVASKGLAAIGDSRMPPDRLLAAYRQVVAVEALVSEARKRLIAYVDDNGPIDLGNGMVYGRYERRGNEMLDGAVAARAIREVTGESAREYEDIAIEKSTSKAAIARASKAIMPANATRTTNAVIERIRALGGSATKPSTRPCGEFCGPSPTPIDTTEADRLLGAQP